MNDEEKEKKFAYQYANLSPETVEAIIQLITTHNPYYQWRLQHGKALERQEDEPRQEEPAQAHQDNQES